MKIKLILFWFITIALPCKALIAVVPNIHLIDAITAVTIPRASYDIGLTTYDNGSLQIKAILGLHDNIYLGVSFDIQNLIGSGKVQPNIPGVIAKFKLTDGWENFPLLIAFGYDAFYLGQRGKQNLHPNPFDQIIHGPYIAFSRPLFIFGFEQHVHLGVRMPVQPNYTPEDTALYLGLDFPIGFFVPMIEMNRVYFTDNRLDEILFNVGVKLNLFEKFSVSLNFLIGLQQNVSRIFVLEYINFF